MMNKKTFSYLFVFVLALAIISLACGGSNEGVKVTAVKTESAKVTNTPKAASEQNESEQTEESADTLEENVEQEKGEEEKAEEKQALQVFNVGDVVEVKDHTIRLNSVEYKGNILDANFTIVNQGESDLAISSFLSFSAKKEDGTKLEQEIFDCGSSSLDGSIIPGDKLKGDICWSGANPEDGIKIYYEASLFGSGATVWNAAEGVAEPLDTGAETTEMQIFQVGELIEVQEHTIQLNSIEYQGTVLVANYTLENHGDSDFNASSMLSFTAKKSDGAKLEQEYFDCGPSLDGSVLPGDRLRGNVCWTGASPEDGIKIYFEANIFGEGAIVWEANEGAAELGEITDAQLTVEVYQVGDLIQGKDHTITLNSVSFQGNVLKTNFFIENQGSSDLTISSMLSFNARKRDGTNLEQEIFDCGSSIDGRVLPGDRLRGDVCWSGADPADGIKIYFEEDIFGEGAIVWQAVEGAVEVGELADAQLKVDVYQVGDVIQVEDHTITLNSVEFSGSVLKANFTIENQGASDVDVSSMLSFYARRRDGANLEQEIFDCGDSFDGSVIPGDKLKGDICYSGASADDGIKIYYEDNVFESGAVVWTVE